MIFKVSCEFYIRADDEKDAEDIVIDDFCGGDFYEEHILIEETENSIKEGDIWNSEELK